MKNYLINKFPDDLGKLNFNRPNEVIIGNTELFRIDKNTIYFGGPEWKNIHRDLAPIAKEDLEYFLICLFTITVIDLTMFTYFRALYNIFRSKTMYPKFGWSGFGPHYENPKKLLLIPQNANFTNFDYISNHVEEYIDLFIEECDRFFREFIPEIQTNDFILRFLEDPEMQLQQQEKGTIIELILAGFKKKLNK